MSALNLPEAYAFAATTVNATYTSGGSSLTVFSTSSPFPQTQQFHISVFDKNAPYNLKAMFKVNVLTSSTVWGIVAELDANLAVGDLVFCSLTPGAMDQLRSDFQQFGTFANLPSTTGQKTGNRYKCTDAPFDYIFDGSAWQAYLNGMQVTPIVTGNWTTLGSGGTRTDNSGSISIIGTTGGSGNVYGVYATVAAGDFTKYLALNMATPNGNFANCMVGFTDGTKTEGCGMDNSQLITWIKESTLSGGSYAAGNGPDFSINPFSLAGVPVVLVKLTRVGTALAGYISIDNGISYTRIFNDTVPYLTASAVCVWCDPRGAANASRLTLLSYR